MSEQESLFAPSADEQRDRTGPSALRASANAPLATRMRPRTLDDFVGQEHVVGAGSVLRRALDRGEIPSMIIWGPPGTGKTTLALLIADIADAAFEPVSATNAGVADLRRVVARAQERVPSGRRTVLFIDEIHRFNKSQQDAVLPHVESGVISLLGATTENPSFEVNSALLSRTRVVQLDALDPADVETLVQRALSDSERGLGGRDIELEDTARQRLVALSGGDARVALNALELAARAVSDDDRGIAHITAADIEGAMQQPALLYDRAGDQHYWLISAFIKSMRDSDPDGTIYWLARILEAGEDPLFLARRMVILAAEDVGLADPHALPVAVAAQQAVHFVGMPEGFLPLSEAALYLATAPKSNSAMRAYVAARADVAETLHLPVPLHLRNAVTPLDRAQGFGAGYRYAHDAPNAEIDQQHLPDTLEGRRYYEPTDRGAEAAIAARLDASRKRVRSRSRS